MLAKHAGMSQSSFHDHFKAVTGFSPAQYQKDVRLLEARRLICGTDMPISTVAFAIGYKSPAQLSRDYARKFGRAPREDCKPRQINSATGTQGRTTSATPHLITET
jgi:transcriptional regulator GlxA family with amidase domain